MFNWNVLILYYWWNAPTRSSNSYPL